MLQQWAGIIGIEGLETRDHRIVDEFRWDPERLPMNFACQFIKSAGGHEGADLTAARVDTITRVGNQILGTGTYLDTPGGQLAAKLLSTGALRAVSIDPGAYGDPVMEIVDPNGNIVAIDDYLEMPEAQAQLCRARTRFSFIEIGALTQVDVSAFAGACIAMVDAAPISGQLVASAARSVGHDPSSFRRRKLTGPTRLSITADREIFGHIALRGQCHRSFTQTCEMLDFNDDLQDFHTGTALLTDGSLLSTGLLTYADLHAPDGQFTYAEIQHVIENTGSQVGPVRAYVDEFGIQVCGVAHSDLTEAELDHARAGTPSFDARRKNGSLRLFGMHVVNVGGAPIYESMDDGPILRLVASAAEGIEAYSGVPPELDDEPLTGLVVSPCNCGDGDDITVPELLQASAPAEGDLAMTVADAVMLDLETDLLMEEIAALD